MSYYKKLLRINLSSETISIEEIPEKYRIKYLGGLGFATRYLYDEVPADIDSLSENNKSILAPGLLTGLKVGTASKTVVCFKSPQTGGYGRSIVGAKLGVALKKAGYDVVIIEGKCSHPVYIHIADDKIEFMDASSLWGKDCFEVTDILKEEYCKNFAVATIGIAGENKCFIAGIDMEGRQAGRGGGGAVWGAKNLKAIVCKGTGKIEPSNPEKIKELAAYWAKIIKNHPSTKDDMGYGSGEFYSWMNKERGVFPSRNFQEGYFQKIYDNLKEGEKSHLDPYYWVPGYSVGRNPCPSCNKPCSRVVEVKEGEFSPAKVDGVDYELLYSLGGALYIDDIEAVIKANELCDRMGLDAISTGVTIGWSMEVYEKGLLTKEDTDGFKLTFGNKETLLKLIPLMAKKESKIGKLLSDGVKKASERLGKGSEKFALCIKGLELPGYDIRGIKGMALAEAVSVRGACHLTACAYGLELTGSWWKFEGIDRLSTEGKGFEVKTLEDLMALYDVFGICKFSRHMYLLEGFKDLLKAATGIEKSLGELMLVGERVYNISKVFNVKAGLNRKDDSLPYRVMYEPIPEGVSAGNLVTPNELEQMKDDYYQARGWSQEGIPIKAKLFMLDEPEMAEEIGAGV